MPASGPRIGFVYNRANSCNPLRLHSAFAFTLGLMSEKDTMTSGEFLHSFSLFDANARLVDWDEGFAAEWRLAAPTLKPGASYAALLEAALSDPVTLDFLEKNHGTRDSNALIQLRLRAFGTDRSWEYRTLEGRTVHVDERRTATGGVRRVARDITDARAAETALVEARQRLEAADTDTEGVFTETRRKPDGSYVFPLISEGTRRLLHLPAEVVGQDAMLFYSRMITTPEEDSKRAVLMEQAAEKLEICSIEYQVRDGRDQVLWIRQSMLPRREPDGTIVFSGVMRDITREKEAEDEIEMLRSVVIRASDSIAIFESQPGADRNSRIVYVNQQFTELFGWSAEELTGLPIETLRPNRLNPEAAKQMTAALLRNDGVPIEFESRGKDGRIFWVEMRISTIQRFENGGFRWTVISRDIGERRAVQLELMRAKEEAEAGNRAKSNFLANMSHELRTPLNAIIGFTELIEQGVARAGWIPAYSEYLGDVSGSGRHLLALINTILDLSKIEAGSLHLTIGPVNLCELAEASLALVSSLARSGGITLSTDLPEECIEVPGDFMKLKQVLLNILSNAIKFTPPGGQVATKVAFTPDRAEITITDTGCGIAEADLERIIQPFVQAEASLSRKFAGSGLGLSIARELCTLHAGKLDIESVEGEGTTVRISLPR
jgi:PAS domain S-box-containing protein